MSAASTGYWLTTSDWKNNVMWMRMCSHLHSPFQNRGSNVVVCRWHQIHQSLPHWSRLLPWCHHFLWVAIWPAPLPHASSLPWRFFFDNGNQREIIMEIGAPKNSKTAWLTLFPLELYRPQPWLQCRARLWLDRAPRRLSNLPLNSYDVAQ